jgi:hypothetical protein
MSLPVLGDLLPERRGGHVVAGVVIGRYLVSRSTPRTSVVLLFLRTIPGQSCCPFICPFVVS